MAIDQKYGKVTTEFGTIGEHEPVVVFRGRDVLLPRLLELYARECEAAGAPKRHINLVRVVERTIVEWQGSHGSQLPTSAAFFERKNAAGQEAVPEPQFGEEQ